ncbi:MAG: glycosyl transferase family 2 [Dehalococcoidia bacterium]|nr:glycosyl transferase family 2 [Dehalococcoidia bacterium]
MARDSWGLKGEGSAPAGYWVPRQNFILGQWVRHAGWWPDHQMRLFRKDSGRYDENRDPHEIVVLQGESGFLLEPLVHHNYLTITQLFSKQNAYAHREAASLHSHGVRLKPHWLLTQPAQEFYRRYFLWEGYKGGITGLFLSAFMAWYRFLVYALLAARGGL